MPEAARHTDKGKDGNLQKTNLFRASIHACVEVSYGYRVYLTSFHTSRCAIIELWTNTSYNLVHTIRTGSQRRLQQQCQRYGRFDQADMLQL